MVVVSSLSCVWLFVNPWTVAHQAPLSMGFPGKNSGVGCISFSRASSPLRDGTHNSSTAGRFITAEPPGKPRKSIKSLQRDMKAADEGSEQSGKRTPPPGDLSRRGSGSPRRPRQSGKWTPVGLSRVGSGPPVGLSRVGGGSPCVWVEWKVVPCGPETQGQDSSAFES